MNKWTTYYHEALASGLNHTESLITANNAYEAETAVILADNQSHLYSSQIQESRDHEEWLDENFGNECLNCGGPLNHSHTC
jgi:hypothetical protein